MCVYTNHNFVIETLDENDDGKEDTEEGEKEKEAK